MKADCDYSARVQECMLLFLTSAAFLIDLSIKISDKAVSAILSGVSESDEICAFRLYEILSENSLIHLNPAFQRKLTGNRDKDLHTAKTDAMLLHRRVLLLAAYAPDASVRKKLMKISRKTRSNLFILSLYA